MHDVRCLIMLLTHEVGANRVLVFAVGGRLADDMTIDLPFPRDPADEAVALAKARVLERFEDLNLVAP
jgi:NitT/TauT family transport system ATP-binding protein